MKMPSSKLRKAPAKSEGSERNPLIEGSGQPEVVGVQVDGKKSAEAKRKSARLERRGYLSADNWTNSEVLQWLIKIDQKHFIPGAIAQQVSGATLLQMTHEDLRGLASCPNNALDPGEIALASLFNHIQSLKGSDEVVQERYGTDEKNEETFGRLLEHPSGWTYDREYNEWTDYLDVHNENAITMHVESSIKATQKASQLTVLVLSSIATLLSSASFLGGAEHAEHAESAEVVEDDPFPLKIITLVITFLTTLASGYMQIEGSKWAKELEAIEQYQDGASKLMDAYDDNLTVPLNDRLPHAEFMKMIKQYWASMPDRLDFSPEQRNRAVASIKAKDPSVWKRGFIFLELRETRWCWKWCCASVSLGEPVGEAYDYALMRFSGEDMGEYTTTPEVFKQDKAEARKALHQLAIISGESVTTAMDQD